MYNTACEWKVLIGSIKDTHNFCVVNISKNTQDYLFRLIIAIMLLCKCPTDICEWHQKSDALWSTPEGKLKSRLYQ
jgi:hypothetical protein